VRKNGTNSDREKSFDGIKAKEAKDKKSLTVAEQAELKV